MYVLNLGVKGLTKAYPVVSPVVGNDCRAEGAGRIETRPSKGDLK